MDRQNIIDEMRAIIDADENIEVDVSNVNEDTPVDKIGFDSLSILEFMYEIENRFGVTMEVRDLVEMKVVECDPAVKGDTKNNATKPAKLETGAEIQVPMFIEVEEMLRIDTRTGDYVERVKK